jgi:hypothetical protein
MFGPLGQIVMLIALTSALRALGRLVGPRRSGLLMGLPSTTAVVLVGCGIERGLDEATLAAEACLAGLVAAAMFPVVFAWGIAAGWKLLRVVIAAVLSYLVIASGLWWLPALGPGGCVTGALVGVLLACRVAQRGDMKRPAEAPAELAAPRGRFRLVGTRGIVPVLYVAVIRTLRWLAGPGWSGRFITFPGGSLALLIATHMEEGPTTAVRLAAAMPSGSFATLAFLAAFRFTGPQFGLGCGTLAGYVAAVLALLLVGSLMRERERADERVQETTAWIAVCMNRAGRPGWLRIDPAMWDWFAPVRRPTAPRRFAPGLERLAG